jgi:hypothetical protein
MAATTESHPAAPQFVARRRGGDQWTVRLRPKRSYDLGEAAATLAATLPVVPKPFGAKTVRDTLKAADQAFVSETSAPADMVDFYKAKLVELGMFPDPSIPIDELPEHWSERHMPTVAILWEGQVRMRLDPVRIYNLDQAAVALAQVYPSMPDQFGRKTAQVGLNRAARNGITGSEPDVDPGAVASYRIALIKLGIFPNEEGVFSWEM